MKSFPNEFTWGTATSAYQIEGAHNVDGRGPSIWDAFVRIPGKTASTADIACDHYHRFKEDVALMKEMGVSAYRFSISWSRILPTGRGEVNPEGIKFYSDLIDELIDAGITPWITLYHWDLPLALHMEMDGWLNPEIQEIFADYAAVCFEHFGDRVKNWITMNESWVVAILGYGQGAFAPGRISNVEPYFVGHQLILSHARAVDRYRKEYAHQGGQIGWSNNCDWREPLTNEPGDKAAAERALEFFLSWFCDPVYFGDYPAVMRERLGDRLPQFTREEKALVQGSSDFLGLNHYTTMYAANQELDSAEGSVYGNGGLSEDQDVALSVDPEWKLTSMHWAVVPWGCRKLLNWIAERYGNPPIYITENGCSYPDEVVDGEVNDVHRIEFYESYLNACAEAIEDGVNLQGYFAWSFMDNFEWALGYKMRFGLHHVDYDTLKRTPKASAKWFKKLLKGD